MIGTLLAQIQEKYPLSPLDTDGTEHLKANGMTFTIRAFHAEGLGHVSVMTAKGFFGLMKMDTLIINPTEKDLPLYSYDRIYAMGKDTLIVELYDTLLGESPPKKLQEILTAFADLPDRDPGEHWYDSIKLPESLSKKGKKALASRFDELTAAYTEAYLNAPAAAVTDVAAKQAKAAVYVEGLLTHGGPSTDVFKKAIGENKTASLFRKILFGTALN